MSDQQAGTGGDRVSPAATRRTRQRAERREQMLDDAVELVRTQGPLVSMEALAEACGVTKPILYKHFEDRDGLVMAMAERFVDQLVAALAPAMTAEVPARQLLAATMDAYLALIERDTELYRFLSTQAGADRRDLLASLVAQGVAVVLERRLAAAGRPTRPAEAWAHGLVGMVHLAGDWWVDHREELTRRDELVAELMDLAWGGLAAAGLDDAPTPTSDPDRSPREDPA